MAINDSAMFSPTDPTNDQSSYFSHWSQCKRKCFALFEPDQPRQLLQSVINCATHKTKKNTSTTVKPVICLVRQPKVNKNENEQKNNATRMLYFRIFQGLAIGRITRGYLHLQKHTPSTSKCIVKQKLCKLTHSTSKKSRAAKKCKFFNLLNRCCCTYTGLGTKAKTFISSPAIRIGSGLEDTLATSSETHACKHEHDTHPSAQVLGRQAQQAARPGNAT